MSLGSRMMRRRSGLWRCRCWDGGVPILRLDGAPFGCPILALERSNLQQLLVVLNLVFSVQPTLADDIVIRFENMDECCRGGWCTTYDSIKTFDCLQGESRELCY